MVTVIFVQPDGTEIEVAASPGDSVMETALANGVTGIVAECNGSAACATCHVFLEESALDILQPMGSHEDDMLDFAATERRPGSRLSCQIPVSDALSGQKIRIAETQ